MKFLIILSLICIFCTGCSNDSDNSNNTNNNNTSATRISSKEKQPVEEEISTFSTIIYIKDENRQNNLTLACSQLNGTIVRNGETFSFCDTLGPAKPEDGYQKADTFDRDGDIFQEYGGGKCQVSSTLYNAVLNIPNIEILERHPHSGDVDYVEEGKDAAVAYGSVDFKFSNNTGYDIKIQASNTPDNVNISIIKIS
ncbi:MAG: factor for cell wall maintenance or synthesis YoaR [Clostridiales bacterium]|nr:factor for cell wall maintenance or synthesis YoaR [Clostridiales bacterium]